MHLQTQSKMSFGSNLSKKHGQKHADLMLSPSVVKKQKHLELLQEPLLKSFTTKKFHLINFGRRFLRLIRKNIQCAVLLVMIRTSLLNNLVYSHLMHTPSSEPMIVEKMADCLK